MKKTYTITVSSQVEWMQRDNPTARQAGEMKQAGVHGGRKPKYKRHGKHKGRDESGEE